MRRAPQHDTGVRADGKAVAWVEEGSAVALMGITSRADACLFWHCAGRVRGARQHDAGVRADGGGSVHDLVRRGALTWAEGGLDIAKDVARGLSYLHNNRIAHLDIKSGNVLLTRCAPDPKNPMPPKYPKLKTLETRTLPDLGRGRAGHRRGRRARPLLPAQQPHRPPRHQVRQRAAHAVRA